MQRSRLVRRCRLALASLLLLLGGCAGLPVAPGHGDSADAGKDRAATAAAQGQIDSLLRLADGSARSGDLDGAARLYGQATALDPASLDAVLGLGTTLLTLDRPQQAAEAFGRARELDAGSAPASSLCSLSGQWVQRSRVQAIPEVQAIAFTLLVRRAYLRATVFLCSTPLATPRAISG